MTDFVNMHDSIQGQRVKIATRKNVLQAHIRIPEIGNCFKYLCSQHAEATIEIESTSITYKHFQNVSLRSGDSVHGESLDLISCCRLNFNYAPNYSNVHGIQVGFTKKFGAAQIKKPFRRFLNTPQPKIIENKKELLTKIN